MKNFARSRRPVIGGILLVGLLVGLYHKTIAQGGGAASDRTRPSELTPDLGVDRIPDRATFERLSYQGEDVMRDGYLAGLEFVKFIIVGDDAATADVYWMNTENYRAHPHFMGVVGIQGGPGGPRGFGGGRFRGGPPRNGGGPPRNGESPRDFPPRDFPPPPPFGDFGGPGPDAGREGRQQVMRGAVTYMPKLKAPDGSIGLYIYDFQPSDVLHVEEAKFAFDALVRTMPLLAKKAAFHPLEANDDVCRKEQHEYVKAGLPVYFDEDVYKDIVYLPLNHAISYGRLRMMDHPTRPSPRDIVLIRGSLPNQLPRVAGVISEVRQTPLSHVNLRAVQDRVPNAFIDRASGLGNVSSLFGKLVRYEVGPQTYRLQEATQEEVERHFADLRPKQSQAPRRDLTKKTVLPLREIQFGDATSFGVKAANVATMQTFGFPDGTVPDGFAVPFYYYDEFMKHNGFYTLIEKMLDDPEFQSNRDQQVARLEKLREQIEQAELPGWMMTALQQTQQSFPAKTSIRCRSSTNNEDLPGFSGAGLYDSCTHHPDEGHLAKSIKQVYASLWNFRAFEERDFYRVDHLAAAMGVLLHPNYEREQANGVAVTDDILYSTMGNYYLNTQVGEDLVTNPDNQSSPEEILLGWYDRDGHKIVRAADEGKRLLSDKHLDELRDRLARIHGRFRRLYGKSEQDSFAMEIEFKITEQGKLAIKQARPWVY